MAFTLRKCPSVFSALKNYPSSQLIRNSKLQFSYGRPGTQETVPDYKKINDEMSKEVFSKVNDQIVNKSFGRLFAVVHIQGAQFKVTTEDLIVLRHNSSVTVGDKIRLEKVLLVGCSDFTLIGRPILPLDLVTVLGTVIEKTLTPVIHRLTYKPRKNDMKHNFFKDELTLIRINEINLTAKVNELGDTDGLKNRIFF